jgi:hypothetical protein
MQLKGFCSLLKNNGEMFIILARATLNEKITGGKSSPSTPSFLIESDATIIASLIFQYVLENT